MTTQRIHLGAIVAREGAILLVRSGPSASWELPGGPLGLDQEDADAEMDAILMTMGINAPAVEEDFVETVHLSDDGGRIIYNLYFPAPDWTGEPSPAAGVEAGWFAPSQLGALSMDDTLRTSVLAALGLISREDPSAAILDAMGAALGGEQPLQAQPSQENEQRRRAGLDVLRTLSANDPSAESELRQSCPELADDILDFSMGEVWQGKALDRKTRSLLVVAMLSAAGQHGSLRSHIGGALNHGASPEAVIETLRMVAVYAGFPAAVAAWPVMEEVFAARGVPRPGRNA